MKNDKKNYNKLKRYWRLLLKPQEELNNSKWKKWWCFDTVMTQSDVVNYLININVQLKETYEIYQTILYSLKTNNYTCKFNSSN